VTLVVETLLRSYLFKPLELPTDHIEYLVLDNIYEEDSDGEDYVPDNLSYNLRIPEMELPGLKGIELVGWDLPPNYILAFFDAICNPRLPSISLKTTRCEEIDLMKLVRHPIFRNLHTINIDTGEPVDHSSKSCLTSYPSNFAQCASSG
jgi:hypothetical protein